MTISRDWVRAMLALWGRWASGGGARGLPTVTAFYRPCVVSGGAGGPSSEVEDIDHIICIAASDDRHILIVHYSTKGTRDEKARSMGISLRQYLRRLKGAEEWVSDTLEMLPPNYERKAS